MGPLSRKFKITLSMFKIYSISRIKMIKDYYNVRCWYLKFSGCVFTKKSQGQIWNIIRNRRIELYQTYAGEGF